MTSPPRHTSFLATSPAPGAVGIIQLHGPTIEKVLRDVTGIHDWPTSTVRIVDLFEIDRGVAVKPRDDWAQLFPHGGPRVMTKLIDRLGSIGVEHRSDQSPRDIYPEARSDLESDLLDCLSHAASPRVIDLLLCQPEMWKRWVAKPDRVPESILADSLVLDRLVNAPSVVVIGAANVGKSTLTNRIMGRTTSIVADLPGTTRDWVAGLAELIDRTPGEPESPVTVRWLDTPGFRVSDDPIEQEATRMAGDVIDQADVLIAMRDPVTDWIQRPNLGRRPDLWVLNKIDTPTAPVDTDSGQNPNTPLPISAQHGYQVNRLGPAILKSLGLGGPVANDPKPWAFSPFLKSSLQRNDLEAIRQYACHSQR